MIAWLAKRIRMEPRQLRDALWLSALLMSITSSYTLVKVARDVLYLSEFPASALPLVYLIVGAITLAVSWAFGRLTHRWPPFRTLVRGAVVSAVVLVAFALGAQVRRPWLPIAFYAWVNIYGLLLVAQFWSFTNSISDPREARNIFGIVGGGGILGGLIGGVTATALAHRMPVGGFAIAGAAVLGVMVVVVLTVKRGRVRRNEEPLPPRDGPPVPLLRVGYVRWLALGALCAVVISGLLDYQMKTVVQELYPGRAALTSFFGRYFIAMNIAALALQILGTRWFLERLGAPLTAGLLPGGIAIGAAATALVPAFWTVIATRLWDQVARFSVHRSAGEVLYFPLEPDLRRRAKAFIEAGIERFGDGLAGILILVLGLVLGTGADRFAGVALVVVLVWLYAWWQVRGGYVRQLGRQLRQLDLDREAGRVSLRERGALQQMVRTLESPYERVVLQAIEMLDENAPKLLERRLPRLLEHASPRVRARALEWAVSRPDGAAGDRVNQLVHDPDPMVRLQALRASAALGQGDPGGALREFLESPDPGLRATALVALVEAAPAADLERVRSLIESRLTASDSAERLAGAEALGARPAPSPLDLLREGLFEDADLAVRRAALRSAGRARSRDQIAALLRALGNPETEQAAREALIAFGNGAVGTLGDWLSDATVPIEIRRTIPRVLREVTTQESAAALLRAKDHEDVVLDYRVLKAENHLRRTDPSITFPPERVTEDLDRDVRELLLAEVHAVSHRDAADPAGRFLRLVLRERRDQAFDRVFRRLALLHPPRSIFAAFQGMYAAHPRVRANAAEYVENVLAQDHRPWIMPLLPDAPASDRGELARERYGIGPMDARTSLDGLLESSDPWLRTCALYVVGCRRERALLDRIEKSLDAADARVRETAGWARMALMEGAA